MASNAKRCPVCNVELPEASHKLIMFGEIKVLTCDRVPLGEVRTVGREGTVSE